LQGTAEPPGPAGPAGATGTTRCGRPSPVARLWSRSPPLPRAQLGQAWFTKETLVWSKGGG
jgi:hypothetical protein